MYFCIKNKLTVLECVVDFQPYVQYDVVVVLYILVCYPLFVCFQSLELARSLQKYVTLMGCVFNWHFVYSYKGFYFNFVFSLFLISGCNCPRLFCPVWTQRQSAWLSVCLLVTLSITFLIQNLFYAELPTGYMPAYTFSKFNTFFMKHRCSSKSQGLPVITFCTFYHCIYANINIKNWSKCNGMCMYHKLVKTS